LIRQTFLRSEMPGPAETPRARWSFADWRIKRMLFDLVQQGFVADVQTRGRQLAIPIATLKSSLDLFAFGIIFDASHQCFEITIGSIAVVPLFTSANRNAVALQL